MDLKAKIRSIENYPQEGVIFRDITTLLKDAEGLKGAIDEMQAKVADLDFDLVLGPESRGFIFGMPLAYNMGKGFVPVRKKGKLPCETISMEYDLEYGSAVIEMHTHGHFRVPRHCHHRRPDHGNIVIHVMYLCVGNDDRLI